jgi:hypothetical protein
MIYVHNKWAMSEPVCMFAIHDVFVCVRACVRACVRVGVPGLMTNLLGLLTGTDALNAALAANGLPARSVHFDF